MNFVIHRDKDLAELKLFTYAINAITESLDLINLSNKRKRETECAS